MAKMRQAFLDNDFETVRRISHKLKGSFNMYGFGAMSAFCADIEVAVKMQKAAAIEANLDRLETYFDKIEILYGENP
jgi:HPt (histidine-containing phosphotransfer) domain-containing protein